MHQEGTAAPSSGSFNTRAAARKDLSATYDRAIEVSLGTPLHGQVEREFSVRPAVVGVVPTSVEWSRHDGWGSPREICGHRYV